VFRAGITAYHAIYDIGRHKISVCLIERDRATLITLLPLAKPLHVEIA